jgi:hypothetical protein
MGVRVADANDADEEDMDLFNYSDEDSEASVTEELLIILLRKGLRSPELQLIMSCAAYSKATLGA